MFSDFKRSEIKKIWERRSKVLNEPKNRVPHCDGTVLGDGSNKGVVTAHLEEFDRTG